jgi:hypothetical protein
MPREDKLHHSGLERFVPYLDAYFGWELRKWFEFVEAGHGC